MHGLQFGAGDCPPAASVQVERLTFGDASDTRILAEECPVALVYDGTTVAVVMATPADLADLAPSASA